MAPSALEMLSFIAARMRPNPSLCKSHALQAAIARQTSSRLCRLTEKPNNPTPITVTMSPNVLAAWAKEGVFSSGTIRSFSLGKGEGVVCIGTLFAFSGGAF